MRKFGLTLRSVDLRSLDANSIALIAIVVVAFILRALYLMLYTGAIDWEGAEYIRNAQNLLAGNGLVGIDLPGTNLVFPPLYSFAIAATSLLVGDLESAARLLSVLFGTALVWPVYKMALLIYDRRVALIAAILIAVHPLMIGFSAQAFSETFYLTLLATAFYWSLRLLQAPSLRSSVIAGIFFGISYLARIEAAPLPFVVFAIALALAAIRAPATLRKSAVHIAVMPLVFMIVASPYVLFLHHETGQWRIEGKGPLVYVTSKRMFGEGMPARRAEVEVGPDLVERGVWLTPAIGTIQSVKVRSLELTQLFLMRARWGGLQSLSDKIVSGFALGSPILFAFAIIGLFHRPWDREAAAVHLLFGSTIVLAAAPILLTNYVNDRYFLVMLPFALIWASSGIAYFGRWMVTTASNVTGVDCDRDAVRLTAIGSAIAAVVLVAAFGLSQVRALTVFDQSSRPVKAAGQWLDQQYPGPKLVADTSSNTFAFHANADYMPLPYTDSETALRYFDKRRVDFIVLRANDKDVAPYLPDWMKDGIPSANARLIYNVDAPSIGPIKIYRWSAAGSQK